MSRYLRRPFEDLGEGPTRSTYRYPDPDLNSGINHRDGEGGEGINTWNVFTGGREGGRFAIGFGGGGSRERVASPFFTGTKIRMRYEEARFSNPPRVFWPPRSDR